MFFALETTLAGIGAFLLAVSGIISSIIAMRKAKQEGDEHCHEQLKECRQEAEKYAKELYKLRLEHPELMPNDEGRAIFWLIVSIALFALATALALSAFDLTTGPKGLPGPPGPLGPQGLPGPQGPTATTIVVVPGTGTNGTSTTGSSGEVGASGSTGNTGEAGSIGSTGPSGETGTAGLPGPPGPPGPTGPTGAAGEVGLQGPQGERGASGPIQSAPSCPQGFSLTNIELKEKGKTILAAICVAQ